MDSTAECKNNIKLLRWAVLLGILFMIPRPTLAQTFGCTPAMTNDIVCENSKTGTPRSTWDIY